MYEPVNPERIQVDRPLIDSAFIARMANELQANIGQGDFATWLPIRAEALEALRHHYNKLESSMADDNSARVAEHAADVATIAMRVFQLWGQVSAI